MENLVNNSTNPIFKPKLADAQIAQLVRDKYQAVEYRPICPKDGGYCNDAFSTACADCDGTREGDVE